MMSMLLMSMLLMDATGERVAFVECKWGRNVDVARLIRRLREKARTVARFAAASHQYRVISRTAASDAGHIRLA